MANAQQLFERAYKAHMQGDIPGAIELYKKALAKDPKHGDAAYLLGTALASTGQVREALPLLERASVLLPRSPMVRCNLGLVLKMLGQFDEAGGHFRKALAFDPNLPQALNNLAALLIQRGLPCEAEGFARRCLAIEGAQNVYPYVQLSNALADQGRIDEAISTLEQALERFPDNKSAWDNLLSFCHYSNRFDPHTIIAKHKVWAAKFPVVPALTPYRHAGRIRVGYLSPDFGYHPVGILMEPVLAAHDRGRFELFLYHDRADSDGLTTRLQSIADHWIPVCGLSDAALVKRIRRDEIDILIDLGGHLAGNRLPVFASRSAPVQATYLGYPGSTGLSAMDFAISDAGLDPLDEAGTHYSESLVRLGRPSFAFSAPANVPDVPDTRNPVFTFGSFNNTRKITDEVLSAWVDILTRIPASRLVLQAQGFAEPARSQQIKDQFSRAGVAPERLELHGFIGFADHLSLVSKTDLCLDPWPWNGHMTTLNCLWMGTPVLTLAGNRRSSRMGACILAELGLANFVANSPADYVEKAVTLAACPDELLSLRKNLRLRMQSSRLMDGQRLAQELEAAFDQMLDRVPSGS